MQQFTAKLSPGTPVPGPPGPAGPAGPTGPPGVQISQQTDVTASRSAGAVYQNTGSIPLFVLTTWSMAGTAVRNDAIAAVTDANDPPQTMVAQAIDPNSFGGITLPMFFIVLPGNFYQCQITAGAPTLVNWTEYQ